MKFLSKLQIVLVIFFTIFVTNIHAENLSRILNDAPEKYMQGYADIVEPLMPAVVNIYTVKYNSLGTSSSTIHDLFPGGHFNEFFQQFNLQFDLGALYTNPKAMSLGSGFIIDETGLIVTNHHVISNADEIHVKLSDNTEFPAVIIGTDPKTDLALLKIEVKHKLPYVVFGNSNKMRVGDIVIAIGNPLGFGGTVTHGIISAKSRDLGGVVDELIDNFIQTDAAINSGNSGGPLFNMRGEVIGVNSAVPSISGGTNIGIGFAIPSNTAENIISQLRQSGKITRGKLDIYTQEITKEIAEALGLLNSEGVLVVDVKTGGAAEKAGLKRGDIIIEFNGKKVVGARKLELFVAEVRIDSPIKLKVIRSGKEVTLTAKISASNNEPIQKAVPNASAQFSHNIFGNKVAKLSDSTPFLLKKYGFSENEKGILVVARYGEVKNDLKVGDLIQAVDNIYIDNVKTFIAIYNEKLALGKKSILLLVKRGEYSFFVAFPL